MTMYSSQSFQVLFKLGSDYMVWSPQSPINLLKVWICLSVFVCVLRPLACNLTTAETRISSIFVPH